MIGAHPELTAKKPDPKDVVTCKILYGDFEGSGYTVHNESTVGWHDLVQEIKTPVVKAAAICSAGEIGLFGILPHMKGRGKLTLVDHSRYALATGIAKYLLLRSEGPKLYDLVFNQDLSGLLKAVAKVRNHFPPYIDKYFEGGKYRLGGHPFEEQGLRTMMLDMHVYWFNSGYRSYGTITREYLDQAIPKLNRVAFMHGDLCDLAKAGPYDLLYISNALGHTSRNTGPLSPVKLYNLVKPGGHILAASGRTHFVRHKLAIEEITHRQGGSWRQELLHKPLNPAPATSPDPYVPDIPF